MGFVLKNLIPNAVVARLSPERVAAVYELDLKVEDIKVLSPGSLPIPGHLWPRPPGDDRLHFIWYWVVEVDGVRKLLSTGCRLDDLDGAKAWVLGYWVRFSDRARARLAPESIPVADVLDKFVAICDDWLLAGAIKPVTHRSYLMSVRRLAPCYQDRSVMDVVSGGIGVYLDWGLRHDYRHATIIRTINLLKRAVNIVMEREGSAFRVTFRVGKSKTGPKRPFTPDELDRILAVVFRHLIYGEDLKPLTVTDPATGATTLLLAPQRRQDAHVPFQRAIPLLIDTATRPAAALDITWLDETTAHFDVDLGVLHRRGEMTDDNPVKKRGSCVVSPQFLKLARAWMEEDLAAGWTHVIHDAQGRPLWELSPATWTRILSDAQVPYRRLYTLKDTAVQISRAERVRVHDAAERFSITPETMAAHYGSDWDLGLQLDPADAHGAQVTWRRNHALAEQRKAQALLARQAREAKLPALPPPRRRRPVQKAGRRPSMTDVRAVKAAKRASPPAAKPIDKASDASA